MQVCSSCGACKFLRRKCTSECIFTQYFCYTRGADHFAAVHKVFDASNVSKLLMKLPLLNRSEVAISISYEALARMHDPIYGCVAQIFALEQQVASLQEEIDQLETYMAYFSFGLSNYASFQEIDNTITGLPFSFQLIDTIISDNLNQHIPPSFAAPQNSSHFLHDSDGQIPYSYGFRDHQ